MRLEKTRAPSFPDARVNAPLGAAKGVRWQVLCGDSGHWRVGLYSPAETSAPECQELEQHDCPELFLLTSGRMTLLLSEEGALRELPLELGRPVKVEGPHSAFCPDGPHCGVALVVERDEFDTGYTRSPQA
ncbi:MAG: hypothetical protein ACYC8T_26475 [Myxococcaceae bacterium]